MRVVGGTVRGRQLLTPKTGARPTSSLIRGSIFNSLVAQGEIDGAVVADLFAGSGALGIEALSRGAATAVFVEADRRAAATIDANLAALGLQAPVKAMTVERWLDTAPGAFDVVLADPPYPWDGWDDLLIRVHAGLVVVESDREIAHPNWTVAAIRRHGGTVVTQLRPGPDAGRQAQ